MKKNSLSKLLALGLVSAMTISMLAGCGNSSSGSTSTDTSNTDTSTTDDSAAEADDSGSEAASTSNGEVPTLVYWTVGSTPADDFEESMSVISDYIEEKIGVRLEVNIAGWGDYDTKMNTIVNSGEYFDIMFVNNSNYNKFVNLGALADITDLVQTASPDLYDMTPEDLWDGVKIGGRIYSVPTYKDSSLTQFWYIDKTYVDKYDIDMSSIVSFETLDPVVREVKEAEGKAFYPIIMDQGSLWNGFFNAYDGLCGGLNVIGVKQDDPERKVVCYLEQDDIIEQFRYLHSWYEAGIINPDANVLTDSGTTGKMFGNAQGWPSAAVGWAAGQGIDEYIVNKVFGPVYTSETIQGSLNAISANSNYKEEALKLLELMNTDQYLRDMCAYGVEGNHFEYNEDGTVKKLRDDWGWPSYTQATFFNMSSQEGTDPTQWDEIKQQNEEATPSVCLGFILDVTDIQNEVANLNTVWDKYKYDLLTGASDPDQVLSTCIEELRAAGMDTIIEEAQKQIDEFFAE